MAATGTKSAAQVPQFEEHQIVHTEFITKNAKDLANFMQKNFGWKIDTQKMPGGAGEYHMFTTPGGIAGGIASPEGPATTGTFSYILVKDIKATTKKLEKAGATIVVPPTEIPGMGWFCHWTYKDSPIVGCFQASMANWNP